MDEFPLLSRDVIEALREPLENGDVTVARAEETITLPARSLVVLAANPCPCGNYDVVGVQACECLPRQRRDYNTRLGGPITDRIDITRHVRPPAPHERGTAGALAEPSTVVRARVVEARERQRVRYDGTSWRLNAHVSGHALRDHWPLPPVAVSELEALVQRGGLSRRGAVRVHRLAWTVADLAGRDRPGTADVATALRLRTGEALAVGSYERRTA